jgi:hypothetical protein
MGSICVPIEVSRCVLLAELYLQCSGRFSSTTWHLDSQNRGGSDMANG